MADSSPLIDVDVPAALAGRPPTRAPAFWAPASAWGPFVVDMQDAGNQVGCELRITWCAAEGLFHVSYIPLEPPSERIVVSGEVPQPQGDSLVFRSLNHGVVVVRPVRAEDAPGVDPAQTVLFLRRALRLD